MLTTTFKIQSFFQLIIALLLFGVSNKAIAQERTPPPLDDFKVVVEKTENGITLHGVKGTAWTRLSFTLIEDRPQKVNEKGTLAIKDKTTVSSSDDFLLTITEVEDGLQLKGLKGTAWTDLKFGFSKTNKQAIDAFGMTTIY